MPGTLIEVLGPGCAKCELLAKHAEEMVRELGLDAAVVKLTDPMVFARYGVTTTPALAIDGRLVWQGRLPSRQELHDLLDRIPDARYRAAPSP